MSQLQPSTNRSPPKPSSSPSTTTSTTIRKPKPHRSIFNPRSITAPLAAITMALILYTYSVTSIRAAKRNAQLHREADGGQLDMRRESLRRHGVLDRVEGTKGLELFRGLGVVGDKGLKEEIKEEEGRPRTDVEGRLEGYKGLGNLERKMREEREGG